MLREFTTGSAARSEGLITMTIEQKLNHARCMANAARNYLNSAYADLDGQYHLDGKGNPDTVPQKVVYAIISHCDSSFDSSNCRESQCEMIA